MPLHGLGRLRIGSTGPPQISRESGRICSLRKRAMGPDVARHRRARYSSFPPATTGPTASAGRPAGRFGGSRHGGSGIKVLVLDLSREQPDAPLLEAVATGAKPHLIVGPWPAA